MVKITSVGLNSEILQRVIKIEHTLAQGLRHVEEKLSLGQDSFLFFRDGLKAYKERCLKDIQVSNKNMALSKWSEKFRHDKDLRHPHRKILEILLGQYDFSKCLFKEVHFSRLVKEARVGKNMANTYLSLLEEKGYIQKRDDGYRIFFRIRE